MNEFHQGEILKAKGIQNPIFVASKDTYNRTGQAVVCPIVSGSILSPTTYPIPDTDYTIVCDQLRYIDLSVREFRHIKELSINDLVEISNIIESLFDYY